MRWSPEQLREYQARQDARSAKTKPNLPPVVDDQPERVLQNRVEAYCQENALYAFHDRSRGKNTPGHPDLIIAMPGGRTLWLELKSKTGRLSSDQARVRLMLMALGHEWHEVRSYRQFLALLQERDKS